jgi:hypothetical protein
MVSQEYYKKFSMLSLCSAKPTLNSQSQLINLTFKLSEESQQRKGKDLDTLS